MKRYYFLLFQLIASTGAIAQIECSAVVVDNATLAPLTYANVGIDGSQIGTVTDDYGRFSLTHADAGAMLVVSYIGYSSTSIPLGEVAQQDTISLSADPHQLTSVTISSKNYQQNIVLGVHHDKGRGHSIGIGNPQLGAEIGARIPVKKETLVESISFVLNHVKGDSLLMRINIYDYSDRTIGDRLLIDNVTVRDRQRRGTYTVDMKPYGLVLNDDVFVSLEWLKDFSNSSSADITFDTKKSKRLGGTYVRFAKTSDFKKLDRLKKRTPCIYIEGRQ